MALRRTSFALVTDTCVLEMNELKRMFKLQPHTVTHVATSDLQTELLSTMLLTGTHLRKRAMAMLFYSHASTLYPQVMYAIAFSAGLNGLQVN